MLGKRSCILLGIGISLSATAALLHLLLRKDEDEEEGDELLPINETSLIVHVPKQHVGVVIGRGGNVIKDIQQKTSTKVTFDNPDNEGENVRIATIRGQLENVQEAKALIVKLIEEQPNIEMREVFIPSKSCGRVIGKKGDNIRYICSATGAKVTINSGINDRDSDGLQQVIIKGSKEQIEMALSMIDEKIAEDEVFKQRTAVGVAGRPLPEKRDKHINVSDTTDGVPQERLEPVGSDGFLEIFVSAVKNPGSFWVQVVSTKAAQLDKMVEEMTEFYSNPANQLFFAVPEPSVGDIVAAFYDHDSSWYRARIASIQTAGNSSESRVEVLYADFGDTGLVAPNFVCKLMPEYMTLPMQAIECSLAGVKPKDGEWCNPATDLFEKLSHVAQWKGIMAKPLVPLKSEDCDIKPIFVEVVDTCGNVDVNMAEELVKGGYATWDK